jgi:hypothetical protein
MTSTKATEILAVSMLVLAGCAVGHGEPTGALNETTCRPATQAETRVLAAEWSPFLSYTDACEVKDGRGKTVLVLLAVSAPRYYERLPSGAETVSMPKPVLFTAGGENVGALPLNFPDDPPFALQVTFANWKDGWPLRIEMFVKDPTVTGDHSLEPLVWDEALRRFDARTR